MPAAKFLHKEDPKEKLIREVGDISDIEVFNNQILVAVYVAPKEFASGLFRPDTNQAEDRYQSKVGLVVKMGPNAFKDASGKWDFPDIQLHDWLYFKVSDGWNCTVNIGEPVLCRILEDVDVRGRIQHPDQMW